MAHLVPAFSACCFVPDRRFSWWNRLAQSLVRLGRALAGERRRRPSRRYRGFALALPAEASPCCGTA